MFENMSVERRNEIVQESIWSSVREEGIPIKCHGDPMDGRSPYMVHEEDDWLDILHDSGRYKSGTATVHRLNIWLDDLTDKWQWALYDNGWQDKALGNAIAHGDAEPIIDYEL
jgi:hypothetical protein